MSSNKSFSSETSDRYALALFGLSKENSELEIVEKNVKDLNEVYKKNKAIRIINHEESSTNGNTQNFDDKYHRETFFISVHTRNLATPQVIAEQTGQSIGTGTSYNK